MISTLGYGELVGKADRWTKRHRFPAGIVKNLAGILLIAILGAFGEDWASKTHGMQWMVHAMNVLLFLIYLGRGSADRGFSKIVSLFSSAPEKLENFSRKLIANLLPFLVNLAICVFVVILVKFVIILMFGFPVVGDLIRLIPFIDGNVPNAVFRAFFNQVWVLPLILSYSAVILDWAFFQEKSTQDYV
jgi:hypothetical protein